ncbi:MAG: hypothetical protein AAFV88_18075 [Planctomycetota bacterium]
MIQTRRLFFSATLLFAFLLSIPFASEATAHDAADTPGRLHFHAEGISKGKVVLVSGDEEYRSEESMPMLAKILSKRHGFDCVVLFSMSEDGTYIDPNHSAGVVGWSELDDADLMIIATRFRTPSPEDAAHITKFLDAGKPLIGLRTSTHAFNGNGSFGGDISYGKFGRLVLGEQWVNHHGKHKVQGARGVIEPKQAEHPILNSVSDVFCPSDVYGVTHLTDKDTILLRGAVTETLEPSSDIVDSDINDPMQPFAWLHPYRSPKGTAGVSFCTTGGASVDLVNEDLRRMVVNAAYFLMDLEVPEKADVSFVDAYKPSFYGFIKAKGYFEKLNLQPSDYGPGKFRQVSDPKGSPDWPFRD